MISNLRFPAARRHTGGGDGSNDGTHAAAGDRSNPGRTPELNLPPELQALGCSRGVRQDREPIAEVLG